VRLEERDRLGRQSRVLDPRLRELLQHPGVQRGVGRVVDHRPAVLPLEVDGVDALEPAELVVDLVRPVGPCVELEAQRGVEAEEGAEPFRRGWVAEPSGRDERDGLRLTAHRTAERDARLAQREIERGALERPAAVVDVHLALGRLREERQRLEVVREGVDRPVAGEWQHRAARLLCLLLAGVVRDVLSQPFLACAGEPDHGRLARERGPDDVLVPLELVALDRERKVADGVVEGHRGQSVA